MTRTILVALIAATMLTISVFAFSLKEFSAVAEQLGKIQIDIDYLKHRKEPPVQSDVRVVDPGDPNECITVTVHADPGTPEEEAESLKAKIEAVYAEFGRCP